MSLTIYSGSPVDEHGFSGGMSLDSARDKLRDLAPDGVKCPCCHQNVKIYKRKLNRNHVSMMVEVYRRQRSDTRDLWVYIPDIPQKSRDFSTAHYFDLIEQRPGVRDDGAKQTGWWRVTQTGKLFLAGRVFVPKYALVYNGERIGWDGGQVYVHHIWESFDFRELMNAR